VLVSTQRGTLRHVLAGVIGITGFASGAHAQWTMIHLHPIGETSTAVWARGPHQVGYARLNPESLGPAHAIVWTGSAESFVDLHGSEEESRAYAAGDGIQVGVQGSFLNPERAGYWRGTASSWTELHPVWATRSSANAVDGILQGGHVDGHAGIWSGTPESWLDLHPPGRPVSEIRAMHGGQQAGATNSSIGGVQARAALWSGTAASFVDLNPVGASASAIRDIHNGIQVGFASFGNAHAGMWAGTAGSWVDLHPPFARHSSANGVCNGVQAGYFQLPTFESRACVWRGTAQSMVDLHPGSPYTDSYANDITENGPFTIVVGHAQWEGSSAEFAVMWVSTTSSCYVNCDRSTTTPLLTPADFTCFLTMFVANEGYANCDLITGWPMLTPNDFVCFLNKYVTGCS
jgi:hypothetical protein